MSFEGKIILVTGASRGIGRSVALYFGAQGATVLGTATSEEGASKISETFSQEKIKGKGYVLNVCQRDSFAGVLSQMQNDFGSPLIVVNNAGIARDNIALRMKDEQWDEVIETNLTGAFHLTKACLKPMVKARWGRIINMGSVVASVGNFGQMNYVATKAGLVGMTKVLAIELASYGITANCVAPGFIKTEMTTALSEKHQEVLLSRIPLKRMGRPEEVAYAVAFLASENASYITGETIHINGGLFMA